MVQTLTRMALLLLMVNGITEAGSDRPQSDQSQANLSSAEIKASVDKALKLIEYSSGESLQHRKCFTCHHQAIPIQVCAAAKSRGIAIDARNLRMQLKRTRDHLASGRANYLQGKGQGGKADTAGYALWALQAHDHQPDATTQPVASYLLGWQGKSEHWKCTSHRPPSEASDFTTSYLAIRGLRAYADPQKSPPVIQRLKQVQAWLQSSQPVDNEDRVFQLRALHLLDGTDALVQQLGKNLIKQQRSDGGWSQTSELTSDAYATGTSLSVLHTVGLLKVDSEAYQRGLRFLIEKQQEDGSWHVKSRSRPFQTYYETGFPHGKDQFISMMASGWSTIALINAYPATDKQP